MKHRGSNRVWIASLGGLLLCACSEGGDGDQQQAPEALINEATAEDISSVVSTLSVMATSSDLFMAVTNPLPSFSETEFCTGGGAIEYGFEVDAEPVGVLSEGDRIVIDYDFCRDGEGNVDGTLGFDFGPVSFTDEDDFELDVVLGLDSLVVEVPEVRVRVNGLIENTVTGDTSGSYFTQSGTNLLTTHTISNVTVEEILLEFVVLCDIDILPGGTVVRSYTMQAMLENEVLPGELLTVETVVPFVAFDGENPYVGELELIAGDESRMRIVVRDTEFIDLYVDRNGDGVAEAIIEVPWATM